MKIAELFRKIKKPWLPDWERVDAESLFEECNLDTFDFDMEAFYKSDRLVGYWLSYWNCTDTQVGTRLYFFDGKPCAMTHLPYRKSAIKWSWVSKESFMAVREFIKSFRYVEECYPTLLDLKEDIPATYKLTYRGTLYSDRKTAYLKGEKVTLMGIGDRDFYNDISGDIITVKHADGKEETVLMSDLDFPLELEGE